MDSDKSLVREVIRGLYSKDWKQIVFILQYRETGSYGYNISVDDVKNYFDINDLTNLCRSYKELFKESFYNLEKRFNKINFTIQSEEDFTVEYYWDQQKFLSDRYSSSLVFSEWLNERTMSILYEQGFGDSNAWQRGIFIFKWQNNRLVFTGTLYNKDTPIEVRLEFPQFVQDEFKSHYEETNFGILSDKWAKWNKITINCPHNTVYFDEDIKYELDENL